MSRSTDDTRNWSTPRCCGCSPARTSSTRRARKSSIRRLLVRAAREGFARRSTFCAVSPTGGTGTFEDEIFAAAGVIGTHHIGASTDQAQEAIADETVRIVREYKEKGSAPNVVNLAKQSPATHLLVVRHFDRVGVLAAVFDHLKAAGINVQETENIVFDGAVAAVARIHLDHAPSERSPR